MAKFNPQDKSNNGPQIPNPKPGVVPARVARVIEIGEHDTRWGVKDQLFIYMSLPTRLIEAPGSDFDGKQHMVRSMPLRKSNADGAALMKDFINVIYPECSDLAQLLDKPCFVQIENNDVQQGGEVRTFTNIVQVSGVPEGVDVGALDTTPFHFSWEEPDEDVWTNFLWDRVRDKIKSAHNYPGSAVEDMVLRLEAMSNQ